MKKNALSKQEAEKKAARLDGWKVSAAGTKITKTFAFKNFKEALRFTNKVGKLAEEANHHPDIMLSYGKVKVSLSTHSAGGITKKDLELAAKIK